MKKLTKKEKKTSSNKFKTILAQPLPIYWPELKEDDRDELNTILSEIFPDDESRNKKRNESVTMGISSALQSIQNDKASCVLFSADIKPKFVVNQAINLILAKHKSTVALIVPLLEDLTEKHFGVKTLAFSALKNCLPDLDSWAASKAKLYPVPPILDQYYNARYEMPKVEVNETMQSLPMGVQPNKKTLIEPQKPNIVTVSFKKPVVKQKSADKLGDFISFEGKTRDISTQEMDVDLEIDKALLINKIKKFTNKSKVNDSRKESNGSELVQKKAKKLKKKKAGNLVPNSNEIKESNYISLKMTKIQKNPDKIKKKKLKREKTKNK